MEINLSLLSGTENVQQLDSLLRKALAPIFRTNDGSNCNHSIDVSTLAGRSAGSEAAREYQKVVDNRTVVQNCPLGALAHLGLGRAYALRGDSAKTRLAYQDFFALWKDADLTFGRLWRGDIFSMGHPFFLRTRCPHCGLELPRAIERDRC